MQYSRLSVNDDEEDISLHPSENSGFSIFPLQSF